MKIRRGDIYYADLSSTQGSEQGGYRPVLIIQNDLGNFYSPTVIVSAITSQMTKKTLPVHVLLPCEILKSSIVLLEQIRTLDKKRLKYKIARLSETKMKEIDQAINISLGLKN